MVDWIPLEQYTSFYYYVLMAIVLVTLFHSQLLQLDELKNIRYIRATGVFLLIFVVFYMGLRPISGRYFGDMATYNQYFESYQEGNDIVVSDDMAFHLFMKGCSYVMTAQTFFLVCAGLYVLPIWYLCKKWFGQYWFYAFLMLVGSFSFWSYGTNGIRNGLATSLFLLAISFAERKTIMILFLILSCGVHKSMVLPTLAYGLTFLNNDSKKYFYVWLAAIPLSLVLGGFLESFFGSFAIDDRMSYLTSGNVNEDTFSSTGFRWDFVLYSATGVYAGYYFVIKRGFRDKLYHHLLNTYLAANAIWILIIRANFSNRFAYLSWFMLGIIVIYPLLKRKIMPNQHRVIGGILVVYFLFTYIMNVVLVK